MVEVLRSWVVGPLELYARGFAAEFARQGYTVDTAAHQLGLVAHLSRWMASGRLDVADLTAGHAVRRDHRAKESGPRAHGNNRQFLSVAPSAILKHELRASQIHRRPGRARPHFPASTAAQRSGPGS
jgi:hypothetical protein